MKTTLSLNTGASMPALGFGTWQLTGETCVQAVTKALAVGYRHIDTALMYGNHKEVGQAIKESGIQREQLFITTKVPQDSLQKQDVISTCNLALKELDCEYLDMYLIHWPNHDVPIKETLSAMQELKEQGKVKHIGVSNFTIKHLKDAMNTGIEFSNNQVEFHPSLYQKELLEFCNQNNIILTAYSPLARGEDLNLQEIKNLAEKYNKSAAQVVLNWILKKGISAIPKASNPEYIQENFKALEWDLTPEDIALIDQLGKQNRLVNPGFSEFE